MKLQLEEGELLAETTYLLTCVYTHFNQVQAGIPHNTGQSLRCDTDNTQSNQLAENYLNADPN